jgi:hypothetical protein
MLNESHNAETSGAISTDASRATVRVIRTDEELMIARSVCRLTLLFVGVGRFIALGHGCFLLLGVPLWIQCATPLRFFSHNRRRL